LISRHRSLAKLLPLLKPTSNVFKMLTISHRLKYLGSVRHCLRQGSQLKRLKHRSRETRIRNPINYKDFRKNWLLKDSAMYPKMPLGRRKSAN